MVLVTGLTIAIVTVQAERKGKGVTDLLFWFQGVTKNEMAWPRVRVDRASGTPPGCSLRVSRDSPFERPDQALLGVQSARATKFLWPGLDD